MAPSDDEHERRGEDSACAHDLVINGVCYYCGTTDIDPLALSPKPTAELIPATRLARRGANNEEHE